MSKLSNESHVVSAAKSRVLLASFVTVLSLYLLLFIIIIIIIIIMHQSIPAAPSLPPPRATAGHLPALSVPGVGHLQILHCPGAGHLLTPGPFPSF